MVSMTELGRRTIGLKLVLFCMALMGMLLCGCGGDGGGGNRDTAPLDDGIVILDFGYSDYGYDLTMDEDGNIYVTGNARNSLNDADMVVVKLDSHGRPDASFGDDGHVFFDSGFGRDSGAAVQIHGGNIYVAGDSRNASGTDSDLAFWRLLPDGMLDPSFDGDGLLTVDIGNDYARGLIVGTSITAVGRSYDGVNDDVALVRLRDDGTLDPGFGVDGVVVEDFGSSESLASVALDGDGKILATGLFASAGNFLLVVRYNPDGSLDPTFAGSGVLIFDAPDLGDTMGSSIVLAPSGRILVAGYADNGRNRDMAVWRLTASGALDLKFGDRGVALIDAGGDEFAEDIRIDGSGNLVVAGYGGTAGGAAGYDMLLARLTADGVLDTGFGAGGIAAYDGGSGEDLAHSLEIDDAGRIVATGRSYNGRDFDIIVWRYTP